MTAAGVVRKGAKALPGGGSNQFLTIKAEQSAIFAPMTDLDEMISVDQHVFWVEGGNSPSFPCIGKGCPGCEMGDVPRYRALLAVLTKEDGPKIFGFGIQVARQIGEIASEIGTIKGKAIKVKRNGSGLKTSYTVVALGREVKVDGLEVPNLEASIGPTTREAILALLEEAGVSKAVVEGEEEKTVVGTAAAADDVAMKDSGEWGDIG